MGNAQSKRRMHTNEERVVKCPVDECDETPLARSAHLHVMRSAGGGHGPQGEIPKELDLDDLESAGTREVNMRYPERRETEGVARLCPYCERPFEGKHGVLIHLGQVRGRKDHPDELPDTFDPSDLAIVHVDDDQNIVDVVEEGATIPTTRSARDKRIEQYLAELREEGREDEAQRAEAMLRD